jgi:hypothetical protein
MFAKGAIVFSLFLFLMIPSLAFGQEDDFKLPDMISVEELDVLYRPTIDTLSQLGTTVADGFLSFLSFAFALLVGLVIGKGVGKGLTRVIKKLFQNEKLLKAMDLDREEFEKSNWYKIHELIPLTVRWFIYITAFVIGFGFLGIPEASTLMAQFSAWVPRVILFLVSIIIAFVIVRLALKWMDDIKPAMLGDEATAKIIKGIISGIIYAFIFAIGLTTLGIGEQIIPIFYWVIPAGIMGILIAIAVGARRTAGWLVVAESIKRLGVKEHATIKISGDEAEVIQIGISHIKLKMKYKDGSDEKSKIVLKPLDSIDQATITIINEAPKKEHVKKTK